jgi:hypothetical protein
MRASPRIGCMHHRRLMPHVQNTEPARSRIQQHIVQVISHQREKVPHPELLQRIHKQLRARLC